MVRAFVALGSNINPAENFRAALHALARRFERVEVSTVYRSEAEGRPEQPPFYNCVVAIETEMDPLDLKFRVLRHSRPNSEDGGPLTSMPPGQLILISLFMEIWSWKWRKWFCRIRDIDPPLSFHTLGELAPDLTIRGTGASITHLAEAFPKNSIEPLHSYTSTMREEVSRIQNAANSGDS